MRRHIVWAAVCAMVAVSLVACGGGGGGSTSAPATSNTKWVRSTFYYDNNVDGVYEDIGYITNDAKGYRIKLEIDRLRDGTIDSIGTYVNDAKGYMVQYSWDNDANGTVDETCTVTNDSYGNETYEACDTNMDGIIDNTTSFVNTLNANHKATKTVATMGATSRTIYREYDANGNTSYLKYDNNNDGIIDSIIKVSWAKVVVSAAPMLYDNHVNTADDVAVKKSEIMGGTQQGFHFTDQYGTH